MEKMKERVLDKSFKKIYNRKEVKHWLILEYRISMQIREIEMT